MDLPYPHIEHLRDCLLQLKSSPEKRIKMADRTQPQRFPYRCIRSGFFVGNHEKLLYYPFPSHSELEEKHYVWWRSANV